MRRVILGRIPRRTPRPTPRTRHRQASTPIRLPPSERAALPAALLAADVGGDQVLVDPGPSGDAGRPGRRRSPWRQTPGPPPGGSAPHGPRWSSHAPQAPAARRSWCRLVLSLGGHARMVVKKMTGTPVHRTPDSCPRPAKPISGGCLFFLAEDTSIPVDGSAPTAPPGPAHRPGRGFFSLSGPCSTHGLACGSRVVAARPGVAGQLGLGADGWGPGSSVAVKARARSCMAWLKV
jgi:hypothetical protein